MRKYFFYYALLSRDLEMFIVMVVLHATYILPLKWLLNMQKFAAQCSLNTESLILQIRAALAWKLSISMEYKALCVIKIKEGGTYLMSASAVFRALILKRKDSPWKWNKQSRIQLALSGSLLLSFWSMYSWLIFHTYKYLVLPFWCSCRGFVTTNTCIFQSNVIRYTRGWFM